ncbi:mitotic checkpoint serine/threonine-protein kinase BUB1 isoform X1 [Rhincodon typus]|uniref:mitotic checkpoint serine/threonine-protein kinase BUB1 isoform X1 n=1 Tax=Rhincodon typus TaxID=259920 RepID=UPI00202E4346|nr:mitotic checkpoint serine/threonine-protein kinase BUB1 isoform X1 [Rhincodon typus]
MDFQECWQMFEAKVQSYAGDDPLDLWDRFIQWIEPLLPPTEKDVLVSVLEKLVKNFMSDKKYSNDPRYVNYWLKLISCSTTPLDFYNYMYSQEVGIKSAALYLAWANVLEMKGNFQIADSIFQKGIQNSAEPVDMLIHHYGCFRDRASQNLLPVGAENPIRYKPDPLGNQHSMTFGPQNGFLHETSENLQPVDRDLSALNKLGLNAVPMGSEIFPRSQGLHSQVLQDNKQKSCDSKQPMFAPCGTESDSLISNAPKIVNQNGNQGKSQEAAEVQQVIMYHKDVLFSGDKEMCFEEIRAKNYFARSQLKEKEEWKKICTASKSDEIRSLEQKLEQLKVQLKLTQEREQEILQMSTQNALQMITAPSHQPIKSVAESSAPALQMKMDKREVKEQNSSLEVCAGNVTNTSFATAHLQQPQCEVSSLLPTIDHKLKSPGFQSGFRIYEEAEKEFSDTWAQVEPLSRSIVTGLYESNNREQFMNRSGNSSRTPLSKPKDGNVSGSIVNRSHTPNSSFGLVQATPSKVLPSPTVYTKEALDAIMDMFQAPVIPELPQVDEHGCAFAEDRTEMQDGDSKAFCKKDDNHQSMEILGMNFAPPPTVPFSIFEDDPGSVNSMQNDLNSKPVESTPWGELSEKQLMVGKVKDIDDQAVWAVCDNRTLVNNPNNTEDFALAAPLASTPFYGVPRQPKQDSEESKENTDINNDENVVALSSDEECIQFAKIRKISPTQDLGSEPINRISAPAIDSSLNCQHLTNNAPISEEFHMIEENLESCSVHNFEDCLKPEQSFCCLQEMYCSDQQFEDPVETPTETGKCVIIKNPWDKNLISELLSNLAKPLTSYSSFLNWEDNMPTVRPKINLYLGNEMFHVGHLLGQGSFAHVYQATIVDMNNLSDVRNQQKVCLKVQKTSNSWEFYINTQLKERLKPKLCNLYNNIHFGHYFNNGSILVGELYSFGTLLNAVNLYKTINEKAMPQPLVIYFAIHILNMVEQLHSIGIIHGDIKPDNFMLGERFLDDAGSVDDTLSQGLTLIDFGQSIDMKLFPQNTVFVENCKTSGFQCIEMLSEKPWTFQTDYFGIAATIHCLLFGTYLKLKKEQGIWKVNATFQRGHHADVWNHFFNTLLYVPSCQTLPSLCDLREKLVSLFKEHYTKKLKPLRQRLLVLLLENKPSQKRM